MDLSKLLVISVDIPIRDTLNKVTHFFRRGEQYEFSEVIVQMEGCGCSGTSQTEVNYYVIRVGSCVYYLKGTFATLSRDVRMPGEPNIQARVNGLVSGVAPGMELHDDNYHPAERAKEFAALVRDVSNPRMDPYGMRLKTNG